MITVDGLVLVSRDAEGKIEVKDNAHDVGKGAVLGAVGGAIIGLVFPPAFLASAAIGAEIGAGAGAIVDHVNKDEIKEDVEEVLPPGSSGIVALFEEQWGEDVERSLAKADKLGQTRGRQRKRRTGQDHRDQLIGNQQRTRRGARAARPDPASRKRAGGSIP